MILARIVAKPFRFKRILKESNVFLTKHSKFKSSFNICRLAGLQSQLRCQLSLGNLKVCLTDLHETKGMAFFSLDSLPNHSNSIDYCENLFPNHQRIIKGSTGVLTKPSEFKESLDVCRRSGLAELAQLLVFLNEILVLFEFRFG